MDESSGRRFFVEERPLMAEYGGFGSSLVVRFPGVSYSFGAFVFAVPLYADFAVETALALIEKLKTYDNSLEVIVAFLGGEKNELPQNTGLPSFHRGISHKGLRDLLSLAYMPEDWVLCYFDITEAPGALVLQHGTRSYVTPLEIIKPLPYLFNSRDIPWSFKIRYNTIYNLGLFDGHEALYISWAQEINSFAISGEITGGETISPGILAELLLEYAGFLSFPIMNPDRHYSIFPLPGGNVFFAGENLTVTVLLIVSGFFLFIYLIYTGRYNARIQYHLRLFLKSFWLFFISIPLMAVSLKVSGFFYSMIFEWFNIDFIPVNNAGVGFALLLGCLIFLLPMPALNLFRFTKGAKFYGFSAVIFVIFGLFFSIFLDFSLVPIFLWALIFVFFAAWSSNPIFVFLCAVLIPSIAFFPVLNLVQTNSERLTALFIPSDWNTLESWVAVFQTALFSLPVIFLAKKGFIHLKKYTQKIVSSNLITKQKNTQQKIKLFFLPGMIVVVVFVMVLQILLLPAPTPPVRRYIRDGGDIISISENSRIFQDSRIISFNLAALENPIRFDVSLKSETAFLPVYSAPAPFIRNEYGNRIIFLFGEHPPNPFIFEVVLPVHFEGRLEISAIYNVWNPLLDPWEEPDTDDYILQVMFELDITTN